jgi:DNA-binding CsgD family transcriptional regulator
VRPGLADGAVRDGQIADEETLLRLVDRARGGHGGALVVYGEAGIGKTHLIDRALSREADVRVLQVIGAEFEMELPFAALHQLCRSLLAGLSSLPSRQRDALEGALGLGEGAIPSEMLVGAALLTLLSEAAEPKPIACIVDDAHWLDHASAKALAFVARRLGAERVTIIFALREPRAMPELTGLPARAVAALSDTQARALLAEAIPAPLDEAVRERVVAEARGNPLALLELAALARPGELAGGYGLPAHGTERIEALFSRRLDGLPPDSQRLLLLAAAEPLGDPALLWRAAGRLGLDATAAEPGEATGLLELGLHVRFRHPVLRAVIYLSASPHDRRAAHAALAASTDPGHDPDRRAWHSALAAVGPDEDVAGALVDSADRARARGGAAARAAFLERAAELSGTDSVRAHRLVAAATAKLEAGAPGEASALLDLAPLETLDLFDRARVELLHGRIAFAVRRGPDATAALLRAAKHLEHVDTRLAQETHVDALFAAMVDGRFGRGIDNAAASATGVVRQANATLTPDLVLDGMAAIAAGDFARGIPLMRRALAQRDDPFWEPRVMMAAVFSVETWDLDGYTAHTERATRRARDAGALMPLAQSLGMLAGPANWTGRLRTSEMLLDEAESLIAITGTAPTYPRMTLNAWRNTPGTAEMLDRVVAEASNRGEGQMVAFAEFARALLHNGRSDPQSALAAARRASAELVFMKGVALRELVEAAVHAGEPQVAADALTALSVRTTPARTDWARGLEACCAALLTAGEEADVLYRASLDHLERAGAHPHLARARLLYGEQLRREGHRARAREELRTAHDELSAIGAEGFAARAARELRATGERARRRNAETIDDLTPQELQVARMAGTGATSKEIAAELFLSPRTIDAHLRSVFRKLSITSRRQLRGMPLADPLARAPQPTGR